MNKIILSGNLARDPELLYSKENNVPYSRNVIAVYDTIGKTTHFIPFVIFKKDAETFCNFCKKGSSICITGYITRDKYQNIDNETVYKTNIVCEKFEFLGKKKKPQNEASDLKLASSDDL